MRGYWHDHFSGNTSGDISLEIDRVQNGFYGHAYIFEENSPIGLVAKIDVQSIENKFDFAGPIFPLDPSSSEPTNWSAIDPKVAEEFSRSFQAHCEWTDSTVSLSWQTDKGFPGRADLKRDLREKSVVEALPIKTWMDFKHHVSRLRQYDYIYRGQSHPWRLRTPFHRTCRADTIRFFSEINSIVSRHVSSASRHVFDMANGNQFAAFLNLIQHHGFPTPLLDWTYSPYVAAFFAFSKITKEDAHNAREDEVVRIFIFNKGMWCRQLTQISSVAHRRPHFSLLDPIAIQNPRLVPQQSLTSFTSVDDIETYVLSKETSETKFLQAIDLPKKMRGEVMHELSLMGVTAGALFPGLDGICSELKERLFDFHSDISS
ncbi:FRG domain-containing protein [Hyphomicrobium sp. 802]|uniref:FRG domain-containing protein n=1 Tax=Hyphomicrobium sp. 802 TaxID=1112272 RepID=UPI00045E63D4|nr:FRG domain-containing protein [Hyphomicrobium sp. 802]